MAWRHGSDCIADDRLRGLPMRSFGMPPAGRSMPEPPRNAGGVCHERDRKAAALKREEADMPPCRAPFDGEPSLSEILADPIVQTIMARDGATSDEVVALFDKARRRLADGRPDASRASRRLPESTDHQDSHCTPR
jgi:hypothetical protein